MNSDSMGNLEKLGILVIVILVVVVGVVAITPSDTLFPETPVADLPGAAGSFEALPPPARGDLPRDGTSGKENNGRTALLDAWPDDDSGGGRASDADALRPRPTLVVVPTPAVAPRPVAPRTGPPKTGGFREVTVRKNDNMWRIAARELGKGSEWKKIASANPSVDPDRLREGQMLRIPTAGASRPEMPSGASVEAVSTTESNRYVVQRGDTPMGLSKKFYGTTRHFRLLLSANGLDEANDLLQGMTIEIPAAPTTSSDPAPARPAAPAAAAAGDRSYLVQKGDNPTRVAREQLGDATRWREILDLNGIADDRSLIAGTRIRLPR